MDLYWQNNGFSSSHVWMWELDYKESWAPESWWFWTMILKKTLESPLDCKEIQPVYPRGDQSWVFIGRTDVEAETPLLLPPDAKSWFIWKDPDAGRDWGQEENGDDRGWDDWISLQSKGLSRVFSNTTVHKHQFFGFLYSPTLTSIHDFWKNYSFE